MHLTAICEYRRLQISDIRWWYLNTIITIIAGNNQSKSTAYTYVIVIAPQQQHLMAYMQILFFHSKHHLIWTRRSIQVIFWPKAKVRPQVKEHKLNCTWGSLFIQLIYSRHPQSFLFTSGFRYPFV